MFYKVPMTIWLAEKHHATKAVLIEYQIKQLRLEIKMEAGPLPWIEYTECADLLTEIRDNIIRHKSENDVFLKESHSKEYLKSV